MAHHHVFHLAVLLPAILLVSSKSVTTDLDYTDSSGDIASAEIVTDEPESVTDVPDIETGASSEDVAGEPDFNDIARVYKVVHKGNVELNDVFQKIAHSDSLIQKILTEQGQGNMDLDEVNKKIEQSEGLIQKVLEEQGNIDLDSVNKKIAQSEGLIKKVLTAQGNLDLDEVNRKISHSEGLIQKVLKEQNTMKTDDAIKKNMIQKLLTEQGNLNLDEVNRKIAHSESLIQKVLKEQNTMKSDDATKKNMIQQILTELGQLKNYIKSKTVFSVPSGAVRNSKLGYDYLVVDTKRTWEEARQDCYRRGFGLASIESAEENGFIHNTIGSRRFGESDFTIGKIRGLNQVWIGGTDMGHEKCWTWSSPSVKRFSYTNWDNHPKEPNNVFGNEHCATLKGDDSSWNDAPCNGALYYVCKRQIGRPVTSIASTNALRNTGLC